MKVLLVHDYASLDGGAEAGALALRNGIRKLGHEARIFAADTGRNDIADYTCFGTKSRFRTLVQTANPSAYLGLKRVLREWKPDVVHVRMFLTQLSPLILPLLRDVPAIYHAVWYRAACPKGSKMLPDGSPCHYPYGVACLKQGCLPFHDWTALMAQMRILRAWRDAFNVVVANSTAVARSLTEVGITSVRVIPNGVPLRDRRPPLTGPPTAAFAGRLVPEKGVDVLLEAFAGIPEVQLLIAGDGPARAALEAMSRQLGLQDRVRFLGQLSREALEENFRTAWVQAVPSRWQEPFGFVAPESMMRGTAVIASGSGGLADIVEDGKTGYLVPPGEVAPLRDALLRLLNDRDLAESMGKAGREAALARFEESHWVASFMEIYRELTQ